MSKRIDILTFERQRKPRVGRSRPCAMALSTLSLVLLAGQIASAAVVELPGDGTPPTTLPTPTPTPRPPAPRDPCELPRGPDLGCFGLPRVDESATILANPVLQRTCGRFVAHHKAGNAVLRSAARGLARPGKRKGSQAWVMALRGCELDRITKIQVGGTAVAAKVIPISQVEAFLASEPSVTKGSSTLLGDGLETVYVQFEIDAGAHTPHERPLTVVFGGGGPAPKQALERVKLQIAHNGSEGSRQPLEVRWEEETELVFTGARLANARLVGPACVKEASIASNSEAALGVNATFHCPVPVEGEPGVTVNDPTCDCPLNAYDSALEVYPELSKTPFNYLRSPIHVVANLDYLKSNPAVVGDSLSHGAFSGTVTERSQRWAYPHQVLLKMEGTPLVQNIVHTGPNVEDTIKSALFARYGQPPHFFDFFPHHIGLLENDVVTDGAAATELPTHTGVAGFDYTNVLRTSGICLDKQGAAERRSGAKVPEQLCEQRCENQDGDELPSPSVDAQLALGCSELTPIEMMEEIRPTFVFAAAAPNHALSCAVTTTIEECLEWGRFERDSAEVFRRLRAIDSIKGGVVFGIPPLSSIPYLKAHRPDEICPGTEDDEDGGKTKLRAFWKHDFFDPEGGPDLPEEEIIDCDEREQLDGFVAAVNARLAELAALNRYAYVDSEPTFKRLEKEGQPIHDEQGDLLCTAKTDWPRRTIDHGPDDLHTENVGKDAGCGIFGLDGAHPSQLGHTVMANELIGAINLFYGVEVPVFDDGELLAVWEDDDLAQDPIDMEDFTKLDPAEALGEGVGLAACIAPAIACVVTNGGVCLGAAAFEGILELTPVRDVCMEPVMRFLIIEQGFKPIDSAVEPAHCWDDHCPVAADANPS